MGQYERGSSINCFGQNCWLNCCIPFYKLSILLFLFLYNPRQHSTSSVDQISNKTVTAERHVPYCTKLGNIWNCSNSNSFRSLCTRPCGMNSMLEMKKCICQSGDSSCEWKIKGKQCPDSGDIINMEHDKQYELDEKSNLIHKLKSVAETMDIDMPKFDLDSIPLWSHELAFLFVVLLV